MLSHKHQFSKRYQIAVLFYVLCGFLSFGTFAQNNTLEKWPTRPIKMIVPFSAGGPLDLIARKVALKLGETLGILCHRG
jgi:tripartite-type tricarboxylate transporter receptor subunit TctC